MSSLFFWNTWFKEYRYTWYALAALFLLSACFMWYSYFRGTEGVIHWENLQEQQLIETSVHNFRMGPFVLDVPAESYVILEYLQGSHVVPNTAASYLFLAILFIGVTIIVALISTLERIWFYVATALFSIFIFTLRFEVIGVFGLYSKVIGVAAIGLYLIPSFYFNSIKSSTPIVLRIGVFAAVTSLIAVTLAFFSEQPLPFYHIVLTSFTAALILTVIFLILVAHEIFAAFVYISSQGSSKSIQHLAILSTIYLANILLTLAHELNLIDFEFIYLNVFLLLTVSAFLGIWGFRSREIVYGSIFQFNPVGAFLFLALGSICFATIAHQLSNANDPAVFAIRHAILFTQAGYGVIFLLYLLSNFGQMLTDNGPVYKVLYSPTRMPYFTFRLAGFIATLALFIYGNWKVYVYNSISGFYNTAGDFYTLLDDDPYAYSFYSKASDQGFNNHRSNYALAMINSSSYDFAAATEYMHAANARRPTDFSLTNAGNIFVRQARVTESISEFRKNLSSHPNVSAIENNISVSYLKAHNFDSALYFLSRARDHKLTRHAAETNFFAMAAIEKIPINIDSVYGVFNNPSPAILSNLYALSGVLNVQTKQKEDPLKHEQLDLYTATYLNNYVVRNVKSLDTVFTTRALAIASLPENSNFSEAIKASLAYAYYFQGNIAKALELLAEQVQLSQSYQGKFNYVMGIWALEQNNPRLAATYFNYATTYDYKEAPFYGAIALTETGDIPEALIAWDSVSVHGDSQQKAIAENIRKILVLPVAQAISLTDPEKYQFCRYRITGTDSLLFNRVVSSFQNKNYAAQSILDYCKRYFENGDIVPAIRYYQQLTGIKLTNEVLYDEIRHFELRLLAYRGELRGLASQINKGIEFNNGRSLEKLYYTALLSEVNGDTTTARRNYEILARYNPYFEDGVIAAFRFFKNHNPKGFGPYGILAEAIQINDNSLPLMKAYYEESLEIGLDQYAISAAERIRELERSKR